MIKQKTNEQLFDDLKRFRKIERKTLTDILSHLQEVEARRAYAVKGHSTLFKYLTRELGYSDSAAARRLQALKLVKRAPESKKMIEAGEFNLSTVGKVNTFLDTDRSFGEAASKFKGKTADECDAVLGDVGIIVPKREMKRSVNESEVRVTLNLHKETLEKFEKLKAMLGKDDSDSALNEICDMAFNRMEKEAKTVRKSKGSTKRRYFPAKVKKAALLRSEFACEYVGCDEARGLEFDHVVPFAVGGGNELENCRVLCKGHNQLAAIEVYGQGVMGRYLNG